MTLPHQILHQFAPVNPIKSRLRVHPYFQLNTFLLPNEDTFRSIKLAPIPLSHHEKNFCQVCAKAFVCYYRVLSLLNEAPRFAAFSENLSANYFLFTALLLRTNLRMSSKSLALQNKQTLKVYTDTIIA